MFLELILYKIFAFKGLKYDRHLSSTEVFEGDQIELLEIIENRKILPAPWLIAEIGLGQNINIVDRPGIYISHKEYVRSMFSIMPFSSVRRHNKIICKKRGEYNLNSVYLYTSDLLGLSSNMHKHVEVDANLLVYPKPLPPEQINLPSHGWLGDVIVRRFVLEDPFFKAGTRDYRIGDPLNRVSWKATARVGSLQTYNCEFTAQSKLSIVFNVELSPFQYTTADELSKRIIDYCVAAAATIAQKALIAGISVGFISNAKNQVNSNALENVPVNSGAGQYYTILGQLARLDYNITCSFYRMLLEILEKKTHGEDYFILTVFMDEKAEELISKIRSQGNNVEVMNVGSEVLTD